MNGRWSPIVVLIMLMADGGLMFAGDGDVADRAPPQAAARVEFMRVHVPAGRIRDLPFDGERLVPMPAAEFEEAAARLGDASGRHAGPRPLADTARYAVSIDDRGRLAGTLEFEIGSLAASRSQVPLGDIEASGGLARTDAGVGEAAIFGLPDGGIAMRISGAGTYSCRFTSGSPAEHAEKTLHLPIVPALIARIDLALAEGMQPIVTTGGEGRVVVTPPTPATAGAWRLDLVAVETLGITVVARGIDQPRLRVWSRVVFRGRQAELTARVVPDKAWTPGAIALIKDEALGLTRVRPVATDAVDIGPADAGADAGHFSIDVPASLAGTTIPIDIVGVAELNADGRHVVPVVRPAAEQWAGGGITLAVDPSFVVEAMDIEECAAVDPETAARWPTPSAVECVAADTQPAATAPATMHFEQQSALARVGVRVRRRATQLDAARITTVEISPGTVLGRAACDVRVVSGEAFGVTASLGTGWFIDSVEAVDWEAADPADDPAAGESGSPRAAGVQDAGRAVDWRVVRSAGVGELRIGLAEAATRSRSLGLRITGHRRGVPVGGEFDVADMDMVRLEGETAGSALVEFRVGPEAVIEVEGSPIGLVPAEGRFAALVEPGSPRGRLVGGDRLASRTARLVRRRPPLDALTRVQLDARDGQLVETFTFTCRPDAGDVDAIVVHFSEPLGESMEWSLVEPAAASLLARRLGAAESERGDLARQTAIEDSWLVEFRPAIQGEVTFRGSRSLPFVGPMPVPLAWVEGATEARGTLAVVGGGTRRPHVVNRRLTELPPQVPAEPEASGLVTELAYGDPATAGGRPDEPPAAELVPADAAEARAWAWREITTAWCHESGRSECETSFDIENRGRGELTLTVPRGLQLQELFIDGGPLPLDGPSVAGGELRIGLPPGRGRFRLVARGIVERNSRFGLWRIDPVACGVDLPVLDRKLRLMVPPDLEVASSDIDRGTPKGWVARLFDASLIAAAEPSAADDSTAGFRCIDVPLSGGTGGDAITVVRRRLIASMAIAGALAAAAAMFPLMRRRPSAAAVCVIAAAIAALWLAPPLTTIARAIWWGTLAGVWCAGPRHVRRLAAVVIVIGGCVAPAAAEPLPPPYRVLFMTDGGTDTVLVPEPLFRLLAHDTTAAAGTVRVEECRLLVAGDVGSAWRLLLEVDADRGGVLVLDQAAGRWRLPEAEDAGTGRGATVRIDGPLARIVASEPGRHRLVLEVLPEVVRRGSVETTIVHLPPAPRSTVEIVDQGAADAIADWLCESGNRSGPWRPVVAGPSPRDGYDVSLATRVRLSRSTDPRHPLAAAAAEVASINEVAWRRESCVVKASYDIAAGRNLLSSVIVRVDPRLGLAVDAEHPIAPVPLGDGRYRVEFPEPTAGSIHLDVAFAMPLADPVGIFEVPGAWLEGVANDSRIVRCTADHDLDVIPELPAGLSLMRPRDDDAPDLVAAWRMDAVTSGIDTAAAMVDQDPAPGERPVPRLAVRRRVQPHRVAQRLEVEFTADDVGLALDSRIDAWSAPLTEVPIEVPEGATVDRLTIVAETDADDPTPIDIAVSRSTPTRIVAFVQQPRCGRFQLRMELRTRERPGVGGRMPLARCVFPQGDSLAVTWRSSDDLVLEVPTEPTGDGLSSTVDAGDVRDVSPGDLGPAYAITARADADSPDGQPPAASRAADGLARPIGNAVEATTVHLAIDRRGRGWGIARFDLTSAEPVVRLRLPGGMRLFDLLVDGRETQATPVAADAWDVRLHDVRWPRSIVAVFAGDVGGRPDTGAAIRLEPPRLEGLPCREVSWTIDAPEGMRLRVAEPALVVDAARREAIDDAVRRRMAGLFAVAVEQALGDDRERLESFAASRGAGDLPALESAWLEAIVGTAADGEGRLHVVDQEGEGVTIRAVRAGDLTTPSRGLVTVGLVAMLAVGWSAAGRWPDVWSNGIARLWPWALSAAGGAWVMLLSPSLPGWALLVAGFAAAAARIRGKRVDEATPESGLARPAGGR